MQHLDISKPSHNRKFTFSLLDIGLYETKLAFGPTIQGNMNQIDQLGHISFIIPGSVNLITSDGRTSHLPIPSPSPGDPLSWSLQKRVSALA
jgi:hypothetical protein